MKLHSPFVITSRLLPGLHIRNGGELFELSIQFDGETRDGRARYRYHIDGPGIEHCGNDLKSGVGGGSLASGMASLKAQTEHTPGPWQALNGGPYVTTKVDPEGEYVICVTANTVNQVGFAAKVASLEDQANARLIAAAPALLSNLDALLHYAETPGDFSPIEALDLMDECGKLLQSIKGEQNETN